MDYIVYVLMFLGGMVAGMFAHKGFLAFVERFKKAV